MPSGSNRSRTTSTATRTSDIGCSKSSTDERLDEISRILKTLITEDALDRKLEKLRSDIQREFSERIESLEDKVNILEQENDDLKETVSRLEENLDTTKEKLAELSGTHNDLEQQGRKNSLRIVGLKDPGDKESVEDCVLTIVDFVNDKLNVPLRESDIDIAHRLGRFDGSTPRNIIVKFTHRRKKAEIIRARKGLKGTKIVVYEDLTRYNQQRLKDAYQLKCVKNSYSIDGKLFVILSDGKTRRRLAYDTPLTESYLLDDANFVKGKPGNRE
ncbi:kinesin-related protein 1-like [Argopecten irradians]|uniref:kinesin-related protein 1-like n=1 Tax=Argopecten irradians TaxID=31199 RepID=UPI00371CAA37